MKTAGLLSEINQWAGSLDKLQLIAPKAEIALREAHTEAVAAKIDFPQSTLLTILLLGPTGAGKSELLNALAGARIAQSHYLRPTTTQPTIYVHEAVTPAALGEYSEMLGDIARKPGAFVTHRQNELRHKVIIDAPDIDSFRLDHRQTVLQLLNVVDVALYVVTPFSYKDSIGWETVLAQRGRRAFAFIINKWDQEGRPAAGEPGNDADADFVQLLQSRTGYSQPRLYRTSARYWVERRAGKTMTSEVPEGDQLPELEAWLSSGLATSHVAQIHARRRSALWTQLANLIKNSTPVSANWKSWLAQVRTSAESLIHDGVRTMQPYLQVAAAEIADERKSARPRSVGILGGTLGLGTSATGLLRYARPQLPQPSPGSTPDPVTVGQRLAALVELRMSTIGWAAHQANLSIAGLQSKWKELTAGLEAHMDHQFQATRHAALSRRYGRGRRVAGFLTMLILELAAACLVGLTIWRIAKGFLAAQYADLSMLISFLLMFIVLVVAAYTARLFLFPLNPERISRELQKPLMSEWKELIAKLSDQATEYTQQYNAITKCGADLEHRCRQATAESQPKAISPETAADVERLFAS